jgi:hypothetical protein
MWAQFHEKIELSETRVEWHHIKCKHAKIHFCFATNVKSRFSTISSKDGSSIMKDKENPLFMLWAM